MTDIRLLFDQKVPVRDGVALSADVYLPRTGGPFPTLLFRTPYDCRTERVIRWGVRWAKLGYAAVAQNCRGRFGSEGAFYPYHDEAEDGHDTVEWVAGQSWCNGKIGTWGRSYGGLFQWALAPLGSPHLTCMAPHVIMDDYYKEVSYIGGAFQIGHGLPSALVYTLTQAMIQVGSADLFNNLRSFRHLPLIDMDVESVGRKIPWWRDWLTHPTYDEYWKAISYLGQQEQISAPAFQQAGWYDPYAGSALRQWSALTERGKTTTARTGQKVLIGPWAHGDPDGSRLGDFDFGPAAHVQVPDIERRWFDHWLKGIDSGFMDEPPIQLFVMGINSWRGESEWPLSRARVTPYYLHSSGRANSLNGDGTLSLEPPGAEPPDHYDYDPERPVWTLGGNNSIGRSPLLEVEEPIVAGPMDQRPLERRDDVLVYTSPRLEADLEITGPMELILYAASSARDTDFTAKLIDVFPNGYAMNLAEGILRARYRRGDEKLELLEPGEVDEFRIRLSPTSNVFKVGHRIRLDISSSNFPRFSRNLNTGDDVATGTRMQVAHQTILHSGHYPSHVLLPVLPAN